MPDTRRQPPPRVQTQADRALSQYPELRVQGLEECSRIFALVAQSLGQQSQASAAGPDSAAGQGIGPQTKPEGLSASERAAAGASSTGGAQSRREWVRRLGCVFDFEILPTPSTSYIPFLSRRSSGTAAPTKPMHVYLDMLHSGHVTLCAPRPPLASGAIGSRGARGKRGPGSAARYQSGQVVKLSLTARDLVRIATGERVPVRLYQNGRLRIKGDVDKALLLGQLLRVTRSQVYHPVGPSTINSSDTSGSDASSHSSGPQHRDGKAGPSLTDADELVEEGLQGQGSGSGDVRAGLGGGVGVVRARL